MPGFELQLLNLPQGLEATLLLLHLLLTSGVNPTPILISPKPIRSAIKKCVGCLHSAWQIVLNIAQKGSLNPETRWRIDLNQLPAGTVKQPQEMVVISTVRIANRHNRLAAAIRVLRLVGWTFEEEGRLTGLCESISDFPGLLLLEVLLLKL